MTVNLETYLLKNVKSTIKDSVLTVMVKKEKVMVL